MGPGTNDEEQGPGTRDQGTDDPGDAEPGDDVAAEAESPEPEVESRVPSAESPPSERFQLLLVAVALVTALLVVLAIVRTRAWDPYLCETDDDCRGVKVCIEDRCVNQEVWEARNPGSQPAPEDPGTEGGE